MKENGLLATVPQNPTTRVSKILFSLDCSTECATVSQYIQQRARQFHASLTVLHVADPNSFHYHGGDLCLRPIQEIEDDLIAIHEHKFSQTLGRLFDTPDIPHCLKVGPEAETIAAFAEEGDFDLIVLPMRHQNLLSAAFADSLPAKVMELSDRPVWTAACSDTLSARAPHPCTLCALDFHPDGTLDKQNQHILEMSRLVAHTLGTRIALMHVITSREIHDDGDQAETRTSVRLERQLARLQDQLGEPASCLLEQGDVPHAITRTAQRLGANLVIAGRSHWYSLAGRVQSTVLRIVRSCPCPVLSLR